MAQYSLHQLKRLVQIDSAVRTSQFPSSKRLASICGVHVRTIERDIAFLRDDLKAPIYLDAERSGYAYSDLTFRLPVPNFSEGELVAFFLAEQVLAQYAGTPLHGRLATAFRKIAMFLPEEVSLEVSELAGPFSFNPGPVRGGGQEEIFDQLSHAAANRRVVEMDYFSQHRNEMTHREVDPYHIHNYQGDWYMSGYCHWRQDLRDFALTRIHRLNVLDKTFSIPAHFDKDAYLKRQFGIEKGGDPQEVALKFSPTQARWMLEKVWHHTEQKILQPDGSLILKMHVPVTSELKRWVMSYGRDVEVLGPEELREMVRREVEELVERYRS
jgi:predicted DNA-binding transcriptional regulator YafY